MAAMLLFTDFIGVILLVTLSFTHHSLMISVYEPNEE